MMVMMSMGFGALGPATDRRGPAIAFIIAFGIILLDLSSTLARGLGRWLGRGLGGGVNIIASCQPGVREGEAGARGHGARETQTACPATYAGKHAAEFTLDARLAGWPLMQRLGALDSLRQR